MGGRGHCGGGGELVPFWEPGAEDLLSRGRGGTQGGKNARCIGDV